MKFSKYHALGNDYIVLNPEDFEGQLTPSQVKVICHRNYGVGSDGILLGPLETSECDFAVRIFNPDGSEAEKSGNGLRIFSRYLWDKGLVQEEPFTILTAGGEVRCQVHPGGKSVTVDMGRVSFDSTQIPVKGPPREVINEKIALNDEELNRTNVQFMKVLDRSNIQIEIWERGAGYTLASGSSSSAAAAVAYRLGLCDPQIAVHTPGGKIDITISSDFSISITGPVTKIAEGSISTEMFSMSL